MLGGVSKTTAARILSVVVAILVVTAAWIYSYSCVIPAALRMGLNVLFFLSALILCTALRHTTTQAREERHLHLAQNKSLLPQYNPVSLPCPAYFRPLTNVPRLQNIYKWTLLLERARQIDEERGTSIIEQTDRVVEERPPPPDYEHTMET